MTKPHNRKHAHDMALAIVGSVCGAAIPFAFDVAVEVKLMGVAVGAAIAPFVAAIGRRRHLRAVVAVVLTVLATASNHTLAPRLHCARTDMAEPNTVRIAEAGVSTVATRTCLDMAESRGRRALPMDLCPATNAPPCF